MLHAKLSASSSAKWLNCPGSIKAEEGLKDKGSFFAHEGTCAHAIAEMVLSDDVNIESLIGSEIEGFKVDAEMVEHVSGYINYVKSFSGEHLYEQRVDFSNLVPEGFGTSDAIIIDEFNKLCRIIDLKYGRGVAVDAENNTQGMLYALGVLNDYGHLYDIETIEIHIYQPRVGNFSVWEITVNDLTAWGEWVSERAKLALSDNAPLNPGDKQCQWCKAKATCRALSDYTQKILSSEFEDLDDIEPADKLELDRLKLVLDNKKLIESYLKAVEEHVSGLLFNGDEVPGYKLVAGRSLRKWVDAETAETELFNLVGDDAFEKKLLTPAKAEKLVGSKRKGEIAHLIIKPEGAPTLAPESDKRKSWNKVEINDFESLDK